MQVSGIGGGAGGGLGLGGTTMLGGATGATSSGAAHDVLGANGSGGPACGEAPGIDTARFLLALMILAALEKDKEGQGPGAAMGFLAGLMLAGAFGDAGGGGFQGVTQGLAAGGLDVMA
ncbi:MAG: hypothetical protein WD066_09555 [Planctomycetaceae bacterium]